MAQLPWEQRDVDVAPAEREEKGAQRLGARREDAEALGVENDALLQQEAAYLCWSGGSCLNEQVADSLAR